MCFPRVRASDVTRTFRDSLPPSWPFADGVVEAVTRWRDGRRREETQLRPDGVAAPLPLRPRVSPPPLEILRRRGARGSARPRHLRRPADQQRDGVARGLVAQSHGPAPAASPRHAAPAAQGGLRAGAAAAPGRAPAGAEAAEAQLLAQGRRPLLREEQQPAAAARASVARAQATVRGRLLRVAAAATASASQEEELCVGDARQAQYVQAFVTPATFRPPWKCPTNTMKSRIRFEKKWPVDEPLSK